MTGGGTWMFREPSALHPDVADTERRGTIRPMIRSRSLLIVSLGLGFWNGSAGPAVAKADSASLEVCGKRKRCRIVGRKDAGKDAGGRSLTVLEVSLGKGEHCERFEHWLVVAWPSGAVASTKLLSLCNDGYGAAGVGEDDVDVQPNRLTHSRSGGSAWRWSETTTLQLSPLTTLASSSSGWWNDASNAFEDEWSWETFKGERRWWSPDCRPDGEPPEEDDDHDIGSVPENGYAYLWLPRVRLDAGFASGAWRGTSLGTCAARADSGGHAGYVVHGQPGGPDDARFAAVLNTTGELYMEVMDDLLVGPSAKWIKDDHIELWLGGKLDGDYQEHCLKPVAGKLRPWGVRLADGQVFAGHGKPPVSAIGVEVARASDVTRLRVVLPKDWETITIAYSDSDDGQKQKRIIATSRLQFGKARTLGQIQGTDATLVSCAVRAGRLDALVKPSWSPPQEQE